MKVNSLGIGLALLVLAALAIRSQTFAVTDANTRVATFDVESAILKTHEGQQTVAALQAKFSPRRAQLERQQDEIQGLQSKLQKGAATLNAQAHADLQRELDAAGRKYKHDAEDLDAEFTQEQARMGELLENKMGLMVDQYARANHYALILNSSNQPAPVFWSANSADITEEMVKRYDEAHPAAQGKK